ncbi:MAG TPA: membrane protein insertion efficiency factor YidD [Azospirillum sp.]
MSPLAHLLRALVIGYQWTLSPFIGNQCRYFPTCSNYALDALSTHGAIRGGWLTVRRLLRCQPWGGSGYDPVPEPPGKSAQRCGDASCDVAHHHHFRHH